MDESHDERQYSACMCIVCYVWVLEQNEDYVTLWSSRKPSLSEYDNVEQFSML